MSLNKIFTDITAERQRQDETHGANRKQDNFLWNAILGEEVGEVATECMEIHFDGKNDQNLRTELVQVAAVAVAWIENLDDLKPKKQVSEHEVNFRLLVQDGVQVLLQKEWSEEDEKPTLEVIFYVGVLKGTYRLYFENLDLRDNAFNEYTGENAHPLITRFKELAKEAE